MSAAAFAGTALACLLACAAEPAAGGDDSTGPAESTDASDPSTTISSSGSGTTSATGDATTSTSVSGPDASTGSGTAPATEDTGTESSGSAVACPVGEKPGAAGATNGFPTTPGIALDVRTPDDYDATVAHPLLVVFAPAGADAAATEAYTGLTPDALDAGYVIAYADHVSPMSVAIIDGLAPILDDVLATWCIDESRVFFTGHSDGGSISEVLLAIDDAPTRPRGAAPSAAGVTGSTMASIGCAPEPSPIMVIHSAGDTLFPVAGGFGFEAAQVWATCNACAPDPLDDGTCLRWSDCADGVPTLYCETGGQHGQWTGLNAEMFAFFDEAAG